ncbi:hypothetical protein PYCC9005_003237 [Savitreella phatthalungensis]
MDWLLSGPRGSVSSLHSSIRISLEVPFRWDEIGVLQIPSTTPSSLLFGIAAHRGFKLERDIYNHVEAPRQEWPHATWALERMTSDSPIAQDRRGDPAKLSFTYAWQEEALGESVDIYVLDSGVLCAHEQFLGRALCPLEAVHNGEVPPTIIPTSPHGTGVASAAMSVTFGMAKKATILSVKVVDPELRTPTSQVLRGLRWVLREATMTRRRRSIINISLGARSQADAYDRAITHTIREINIPVITSAGNGGGEACAHSPNSADGIIVVSGSTIEDTFYDRSNHGHCVCVMAPAHHVVVASINVDQLDDFRYVAQLSGTSAAAGYVSGIVAIMMSWPERPRIRAAELEHWLQNVASEGVLLGVPPDTSNYLARATFQFS